MKENNMLKAFALIISACVIATSLAVPMLADDQDDLGTDNVTLSKWEWHNPFKGMTASQIAASVVTHAIPFVGLLWDGVKEVPSDDTSDESYPEVLRDHEAELLATVLDLNKGILTNAMDGYSNIWVLTNAEWMRRAEVAAAEMYTTNANYDASLMLIYSTLNANVAKLFENVEVGPDQTMSLINDRLTKWSENSTYAGNSVSVRYGNSTAITGAYLDLEVRNAILVTSGDADAAYLDNRELWVFGASNAIITSADGSKYTLSEGYNDLKALGIPAGVYEFQAGRSYAGSITSTITSDAAELHSAAIISSGSSDGSLTYKLAVYNGTGVTVGGTDYNSLNVRITTTDAGAQVYTVDMLPILKYWQKLIDETENSMAKAHAAASAAWRIYDTLGEANVLISPSSMVSASSNASSEQMYSMYISYLSQAAEYYERTGEYSSGGISVESLNIYLRADVYDANGSLIYQNAVCTPYIWNKDLTLSIGKVGINQAGTLSVWDTAENLTGWSGSENKPVVFNINSGYTLDVKQIMYDGKPSDKVTLSPAKITAWVGIDDPTLPGPVKEPHYVNTSNLVMIILFEAAAIVALLAFLLRNPTISPILLIIAMILAVLAFVGSGWIAGFL